MKVLYKKNKVAAIIQARMTSTRLPGKVLMNIEQKPMLWHIINRLKSSVKIDDIILAIPDTKENDSLEIFSKKNNIDYFRGSEEDVLSRYYNSAKKYHAEVVVRITADCPLIDPEVVDMAIEKHLASGADYTSNILERTFPRGLDVEVFNSKALAKSYKEAKESYQKEHVTPYIWELPEKFHLANIENPENFSHMRWTVDEREDLEFVREIYKRLSKTGKIFLMRDITNLLKKYPELMEINKNVKQKEA